jgi:hypothetical protein
LPRVDAALDFAGALELSLAKVLPALERSFLEGLPISLTSSPLTDKKSTHHRHSRSIGGPPRS